ncbi:MAG TPA: hypothetical protein ENJ36_04095 [Candidatus Bathyarchaeota archaeon]|nr:hypothetical protein [Candidatus Bathyarchaeota archaeon]
MVFLKKKDYKKEKMVLITGTVFIFVAAILGTQMMVNGRVYIEKVEFLERKGYILNTTVAWSNYETWIDNVNRNEFKGKMTTEYREVTDWTEFYALLRESEKAPIFDDSFYGTIYHCPESCCIWFMTINSRLADGKGRIQTYVIFPD